MSETIIPIEKMGGTKRWTFLTSLTTKDGSGVTFPSSFEEVLFLPVISDSPIDASVYPKIYLDTLSSSTETWAILGGKPDTYIIVKLRSNKFRVHAAFSGSTETSFKLLVYYR